ncbi:hypothetical protein L226DRAFT_23918 [Lentinus tigrinus ALCF2SS1-7]|uniref:uncharacterized protein n=1 Tax=Lentinus tigrinus ALCF2SS1-7 TaxID=1328758 RepID=UPI001166336A|nr:hypothetical protein L226DRAFT_23918 [Lentinus tigrinus ALCF2SS1-7]
MAENTSQYESRYVYGPVGVLNWPQPKLYELWWSDEALRETLRTIEEPKLRPERVEGGAYVMHRADELELRDDMQKAFKTRLRFLNLSIKDLEFRRLALGRYSLDIEAVLFRARATRRLLLWQHFPIRQLPEEILSTIFRYAVWSVPGPFEADYTRKSLTSTCKHFREVAIADQTLWNSVWFLDKYPWSRSFTFLERAGTSPLDVRFGDKEFVRAGETVQPMTIPQLDYLLDALLPKISQIRIIVVRFESSELVEHFMKRFGEAGAPTSLERYEVHRTSLPYLWPPEKVDSPIPLNLFPAPRLRWLCLDGVAIDFAKIQWTNLQTVDFRRMCVQSCPTSERFTEMLETSPALYKLSLDAAGPRWTQRPISGIRRVEVPNLRELLIGDVSCLFSMYMLSHIHAPRLMALSLVHLGGQDYSQTLDMMRGMFPELQMLSIVTLELPKSDAIMRKAVLWLESMPRIKMLKVVATKRTILDAFYQDPTQYWTQMRMDAYIRSWKEKHGDREVELPVLLPNLEYLYFHKQNPGDEISTLTTGRQALGVPFKKVYIPDIYLQILPADEREKIKNSVGALEAVEGLKPSPTEMDIYREMIRTVDKSMRIQAPYYFPPNMRS